MDDLSTTDAELWRRAAEGDPEGFAVIFDRHAHAVRSYCARRTGSLDAAEDLVSIVFLEAWRRRAEVQLTHDSALPWLYGVASHTISHRLRTSLRHRRALMRMPAVVLEPDHAEGVTARMDDQRRVAQAHAALRGLTRADQEVLLLCLWQELDYAAASVALGVPVGTVRSRLSRARTRLRAAMQQPSTPPSPSAAAPPNPEQATVPELRDTEGAATSSGAADVPGPRHSNRVSSAAADPRLLDLRQEQPAPARQGNFLTATAETITTLGELR